MCILTEIVQHFGGIRKWGFGVNDPVGLVKRTKKPIESGGVVEGLEISKESKLTEVVGFFKKRKELTAKKLGKDGYRKEELLAPAADPSVAI